MNTKGAMAGAIKVGTICQPLRAVAVPGSGASAAMMIAASINNSRNTPKSFSFSSIFKGLFY